MAKFNSTVATLAVAATLASGGAVLITSSNVSVLAEPAHAQEAARPRWAASATGRIEPKDGEVRVSAQGAGEIEQVLAKTNDRVTAGDLLVKLDDADALDRIAGAEAEVQVRQRERDEEDATGLALDRRRAEDALARAERELFGSRIAFDEAVTAQRAGSGNAEAATKARDAVRSAEQKVESERANLAKVLQTKDVPLPSRLESGLAQARSELSLAEGAFDKTRVRAPFEATVLNVYAREGELAAPSADASLLTLGDLSTMRVRAEVEERDVTKVRIGQGVVVKADAYPDQEFEGKVTSIAGALGSPRIASRGPRRPTEVEVLEVVAELDGNPPLLTGMRVDVFFKLDAAAQTSVN